MRNIDGLQPQEAFDELLKYLFFKQFNEGIGPSIPIAFTLQMNGSFEGVDHSAAKKIRSLFRDYLLQANTWSTELWKDKKFHLSDAALMALHGLFQDVHFRSINFDIRSNALKTFLTPKLRRGLGIFLTPDDVARMIANIVRPKPTARVYDPACGSGTFLIEVLNYWNSHSKPTHVDIWGSDINPRMLLLAELNLGHLGSCTFHRQIRDTLTPTSPDSWAAPNSFDFVITNPPFGVVINSAHYAFDRFETCRAVNGKSPTRQQSEIVFIEQCLRLLKPGGILAIVLPKSVITNRTLAVPREAINRLGYVYAVVSLPAETFAITGTQTTTSVVFFKKFSERTRSEHISIVYANVKNVGYDTTGRPRKGNQLPGIAADIQKASEKAPAGICLRLPQIDAQSSLSNLGRLISGQMNSEKTIRLRELVEVIKTGQTPTRLAYTDSGLFIVKVGNLTGHGISWTPRDRNFVSETEAAKRRCREGLMLQRNDLLLTSSAHSPVYIAKKIDIVTEILAGDEATYVGEVMLLRPKKGSIDPFLLLAYLRQSAIVEALQLMISGQTAHLMPQDVADLQVPETILKPSASLRKAAKLLQEEAKLAIQMNRVTAEIGSLIAEAAAE